MATSSINLKLITYEWNGKKFTSQQRLNDLFVAGAILREITGTKEYNGFIYGHYYQYRTLDGREIAKIYKDTGFGFCSQATGVELKTVISLSIPARSEDLRPSHEEIVAWELAGLLGLDPTSIEEINLWPSSSIAFAYTADKTYRFTLADDMAILRGSIREL